MPRETRKIAQGCTHHCYTMCHGRRGLLKGHYGKKYFVEAVKRCQDIYEFDLIAAEIVENHIHLVIKTLETKENVSRIMQYIKARIAERYNRANSTTGSFWNGRFGSAVIEESDDPENYLLYLLWYIGYNPVRKKISSDPRKNPIGFINRYLNKDAEICIKITVHEYFYQMGNTFEECVLKFLLYEEAYKKRLNILF